MRATTAWVFDWATRVGLDFSRKTRAGAPIPRRLKVHGPVVEAHYRDVIDAMYGA